MAPEINLMLCKLCGRRVPVGYDPTNLTCHYAQHFTDKKRLGAWCPNGDRPVPPDVLLKEANVGHRAREWERE